MFRTLTSLTQINRRTHNIVEALTIINIREIKDYKNNKSILVTKKVGTHAQVRAFLQIGVSPLLKERKKLSKS